MAGNGSADAMQVMALELAFAVGLPLLALTTVWFGRRDIAD